ncbi:glycoside hydrolase family 5 protein [Pseudomonas lutea]|uniref:Glycoside hydrolase family 5 protein n=2 Tax=Pseudomonas luteola TaxID=47886 RepID=A0ABS0MSV6_PSELU|nr:glycoside hydrolase family 5 protein [Pseudomonas luteola]
MSFLSVTQHFGITRGVSKALSLTALLALGSTAVQAEQVNLVGLNMAGAEFAGTVLPGINEKNYIFAKEETFKNWSARGIRLVRFPILWERLQPGLGYSLDQTYASLISRSLDYAHKYNIRVILDLHNYARYRGHIIGTSSVPYYRFENVWNRIAQKWGSHPAIYGYDIMNEPNGAVAYWPTAAQYAINGIRQADKAHLIFAEGNAWASAERWPVWSDSLKDLKDPVNKLIYEAHVYFDADGGGSYTQLSADSLSAQAGVNRVKPFVEWLKQNNKKGFIGEFGVPDNDSRWNVVMDNMLTYLKQHCVPATYRAAGPGWGNYSLSVEPINGQSRPQWPTLRKHLNDTSCTAIGPGR